MNDPEALTNERKNQHGDWKVQSACAAELRATIEKYDVRGLPAYQKEALHMIATKISRVLNGDPNHADHWDDIAGYAFLGKASHGK